MNGRMYDPVVGRVLSPDNFVQNPYSTQSYNRYSYVMNNPLRYTDPSGHTWLSRFKNWVSEQNPVLRSTVFLPTLMTLNPAIAVIDAATLGGSSTGFVQGGFEAGTNKVMNFNKLLGGQFKGTPKQVASRHQWEAFQNSFGLIYGIFLNVTKPEIQVDYIEGATIVTSPYVLGDGSAVTIGSYIYGNSNDLSASTDNNLFLHEYGHYLQSQHSGPAFLYKYGLPSLKSASKKDSDHDLFWVEIDANTRSFEYFKEKIDVSGWGDAINPRGGQGNTTFKDHLLLIINHMILYKKIDRNEKNKPCFNRSSICIRQQLLM